MLADQQAIKSQSTMELASFVIRSLDRNDQELAALQEIHHRLHALKQEFEGRNPSLLLELGRGKIRLTTATATADDGEDRSLLRSSSSSPHPPQSTMPSGEQAGKPRDDSNSVIVDRLMGTTEASINLVEELLQQALNDEEEQDIGNVQSKETVVSLYDLAVSFLLHFKLRRRLLNRLARRLLRVAHAIDTNKPPETPQLPSYGDLRLHVDAEAVQALDQIRHEKERILQQQQKFSELTSVSDNAAPIKSTPSRDEGEAKPMELESSDGNVDETKSETTGSEKKEVAKLPSPETIASCLPRLEYQVFMEYKDPYEKRIVMDLPDKDGKKGGSPAEYYSLLERRPEEKPKEDYELIPLGASGIGATSTSRLMTSTTERQAEFQRWKTNFLQKVPQQPTFPNEVYFYKERVARAKEMQVEIDERAKKVAAAKTAVIPASPNKGGKTLKRLAESRASDGEDADKKSNDEKAAPAQKGTSGGKQSEEVKLEEEADESRSEVGAKPSADDAVKADEENKVEDKSGTEAATMDVMEESTTKGKTVGENDVTAQPNSYAEPKPEEKGDSTVRKTAEKGKGGKAESKPTDGDDNEEMKEERESVDFEDESEEAKDQNDEQEETKEERNTVDDDDSDEFEDEGNGTQETDITAESANDEANEMVEKNPSDDIQKSAGEGVESVDVEEKGDGNDAEGKDDAANGKEEGEAEPQEDEVGFKRPISLVPTPSFFTQDLKRIRMIHAELMSSSIQDNSRARLEDCTREYNKALRHSNDLYEQRQNLQAQLNHLVMENRTFMSQLSSDYQVKLTVAHKNWDIRRRESDAQKMNSLLPHRNNPNHMPQGTPMTHLYMRQPDPVRQVVAQYVGSMVDAVEKVEQGVLAHNPYREPFRPPPQPDGHIAHKRRMEEQVQQELNNVIQRLHNNEDERSKAWKRMIKTKAELDVPHHNMRTRVELNLNNYNLIPLPPLRHSAAQNVPQQIYTTTSTYASYIPQARSQQAVSQSQSKYSAAKVRARVASDGSVAPVTAPKRDKNGLFIRPGKFEVKNGLASLHQLIFTSYISRENPKKYELGRCARYLGPRATKLRILFCTNCVVFMVVLGFHS